jgi:hypothetical protein
MNREDVKPPTAVARRLRELFLRNGYVRRFNPKRRKEEPRSYKKGDEVRLVAQSHTELREIRRLLRSAGFTPGRPFRKDAQWRQPIYGRRVVARFLLLIGNKKSARP